MPGEVDPLLAVPVGDEPVEPDHVHVEQLGGQRTGLDGGETEHPGPDRLGQLRQGGHREAAVLPGGLQGAGRHLVEVRRVRTHLVGRPGQRRGDAGAQLALQHRQHLVPHPAPG